MAEFDGAGNLLREMVWNPSAAGGVGGLVLLRTQAGVFRPICDFRGNVLALLDESGDIAESYRYDGFGRTRVFDGTGAELTGSALGNPFGFACKRYDPTTALCHFGARWYDPALGRFLSPDPLGFVDGPNRYAYCAGDPVNFVDPWGLCGRRAGLFAESAKLAALLFIMRAEQSPVVRTGSAFALQASDAVWRDQKDVYDLLVYDLPDSFVEFLAYPDLGSAFALFSAGNQAAGTLAIFVPGALRGESGNAPESGPKTGMGPGAASRSDLALNTFGSRGAAFREAKTRGGVPRSQQPSRVYHERTLDQPGNVQGRVYEFRQADGSVVTIREHSLGHVKGDLGSHFNVEARPAPNQPRVAVPEGEHVFFE